LLQSQYISTVCYHTPNKHRKSQKPSEGCRGGGMNEPSSMGLHRHPHIPSKFGTAPGKCTSRKIQGDGTFISYIVTGELLRGGASWMYGPSDQKHPPGPRVFYQPIRSLVSSPPDPQSSQSTPPSQIGLGTRQRRNLSQPQGIVPSMLFLDSNHYERFTDSRVC
jgi:hypothetical protein